MELLYLFLGQNNTVVCLLVGTLTDTAHLIHLFSACTRPHRGYEHHSGRSLSVQRVSHDVRQQAQLAAARGAAPGPVRVHMRRVCAWLQHGAGTPRAPGTGARIHAVHGDVPPVRKALHKENQHEGTLEDGAREGIC